MLPSLIAKDLVSLKKVSDSKYKHKRRHNSQDVWN